MSIFVSGGIKGIGLAIAKEFAEPGAKVFLNYLRDDQSAAKAKQEIEGVGATCHLIKQDVGSPEGAKAAMAAVAEHTDKLDQLVHCAVRVLPEPILSVDPTQFARAVELNGLALMYLVQEALPLFQRGSTAFFLSSRGGRVVVPNYAAVGVSKSLGEALVRYLAIELAPRGIRINAVAPSGVDTDAVRAVYGDKTDEILAQGRASNPSGRGIEDQDYTSLVRYLASPQAKMIQGQTIFVNGGANLMP